MSGQGDRIPTKAGLTKRIVASLAALATALIFWAQSEASACACGEPRGHVVARGDSLYDVPWRIKARLVWASVFDSKAVEVNFLIGRQDDYSGVGYSTTLGYPLHSQFVFTATAGSEIDDFPESDLSGIARGGVATLVIKMTNGESLTISPTSAPDRLRNRFRWLRGLRFFDVFFPADQVPQLVSAFDGAGHLLARHRSWHGSFR